MLGILTLGLLVITLTTASHRLLMIELTHYDRLFRAHYVECNDVDVTELVHMYAEDCWDFAEMEEFRPGNVCGTAVGTLSFYNEKNRLFHQINIIVLNENNENPRIYAVGGRQYAFSSNDWKSYGYTYGFPKGFAEKVLLLIE